jgi:thioredoxin reductase (NADPH)
MPHHHHPLIILGSGPAGYTAAIYAARAMLAPVLIQGSQPGGQLTITTDVENYPGFAKVIQGPWLMEEMRAQAEHVGTGMVMDHISKVDLSRRPFRLEGDSGDAYTCDALIICTGAQARWLGIPSEEHFKGFGVSACATCDGFFYKGKDVIVAGGGNTAMEEALFLTKFAKKVTIVHRRNEFRGERILRDRVAKHPQIEVAWDSTIAEIVGTEKPKSVTGVRLASTTGKPDRIVPADGVFIASRRLCRRRREGRDLPAGGDCCRHGLHGSPRSRALPRPRRRHGACGRMKPRAAQPLVKLCQVPSGAIDRRQPL